eukprot:GHRQ01027754.1.p1 GENE.GHRQ01027754.1~~GHRQ01027754.1.p1  ORF type:complete len:417 (+),score=125.98 GHRQ01027754.1:275-1525(+)
MCLVPLLQDTWRCVTVDDRIPVDLFGRALLVGSRPLQLWPLLLCKALLKVMAVYKTLDMTLPHQVRAAQGRCKLHCSVDHLLLSGGCQCCTACSSTSAALTCCGGYAQLELTEHNQQQSRNPCYHQSGAALRLFPPQVAAFQMLTGWPQEDLLDPLGGTQLEGGGLFSRLEEVLGGPLRAVQASRAWRAVGCFTSLQERARAGNTRQLGKSRDLIRKAAAVAANRTCWVPQYETQHLVYGVLDCLQELPAVASCCLVRRSKPQRAPPRLVVLSGPSGVGRSRLIARLLAEFPDKFGVTVSHTTRPPREHEVDGKDYYFTVKPKLLADVRSKKFLEAARVAVHTRPCTSSEAAAAAAPPRHCSYWYGTSLATVREVAATGKLCLMSLDTQGAEVSRLAGTEVGCSCFACWHPCTPSR